MKIKHGPMLSAFYAISTLLLIGNARATDPADDIGARAPYLDMRRKTGLCPAEKSLAESTKQGDSVQWVCTAPAKSLVVRFCIPDSDDGHDIPRTDVLRRFQRGWDNLPAYCAVADSWAVYDNSRGAPVLI